MADISRVSIDGGETFYNVKDATARQNITEINNKVGANNGIASLNGSGKVPESQLPSYVDDVVEGYLYEGDFYKDSQYQDLITPESGKIYIDLSTNKTYRWGGTVYVNTGSALELGETQGTAYEGSKGKANADAIDDIIEVIPSNASSSNKLLSHQDIIDNLTSFSSTKALSAKQGYELNSKIAQSNLGKEDMQKLLKDTVGWTCKNKLPLTLASLKAINTAGTWNDNAYTIDGVTFTVSTNSEGYVTKINVNGTASSNIGFNLLNGTYEGAEYETLFPLGSYYWVTGCASDASSDTYYYRYKLGSMYVSDQIITGDDHISIDSSLIEHSRTLIFDIKVNSGVSVSNIEFYPQWMYGHLEDKSFEPYNQTVKDKLTYTYQNERLTFNGIGAST